MKLLKRVKTLGHLKDLRQNRKRSRVSFSGLIPIFLTYGKIKFHEWVLQPCIYRMLSTKITQMPWQRPAIDLYKADTGKRKPRLRNQRQRPLTFHFSCTKRRTKSEVLESQVAKMSDKEYDANEAAILEAMRRVSLPMMSQVEQDRWHSH